MAPKNDIIPSPHYQGQMLLLIAKSGFPPQTVQARTPKGQTGLTLPHLGIPEPHLSWPWGHAHPAPDWSLPHPTQGDGFRSHPGNSWSPWSWDCWAEGIHLSQDTSHCSQGQLRACCAWPGSRSPCWPPACSGGVGRWASALAHRLWGREGSAGPKASQSHPAPGWGILTQGLLFEVGTLQAVLGCGPAGTKGQVAGTVPAWGMFPALPTPHPAWLLPFLGVIHEEEVEQAQPSLREPGKPVLQVVVGLFAQGVLGGQRQLGESLGETQCEEGPGEQPGRKDRENGQGALTGQMFSLGVPRSCTMRSIWWISEVPGSRGLCASSSARMQPAALGRSTAAFQ